MLLIPVHSVVSQSVNTLLDNQPTVLNIYQKGNSPSSWALFMDILLNSELLIGGVLCENMNVIIRNAYLGYSGDFAWFDTRGTSDPVYTSLGTRFQLWWFAPTDLPVGLS